MTKIQVTKRDGNREDLDLEKIHKVVFWACEGISGVSASEIELRAQLQIENGTPTTAIHETLIKSASELISAETPNYQYVASRLANYQLRKEVYGRYEPGTVRQLVEENVRAGVYTDELLTNYDDDDWRKIEKIVKHSRDDLIAYAGMEQWRGKYLVKNRVTGRFYETPQMALVLIAAVGFMSEPKNVRMQYIKEFYDSVSKFDISLPTPIMAGLRTPEKQFSSCVTLAVGDDLDSIGASSHAVMRYISQKAGLGIDMSRIRAIGDEVAGGRKEHMGAIPYVRLLQASVKSCSQGGVRGGSATVHFPLWTYEFPELVVLKNNKGTEFNRVRQMDYCFLFNRTMYQRLIDGANISFFSMKDVPGLLEAFWRCPDEFDALYRKYESKKSIRRRSIPALEVFKMFMTERKETGRIYLMNVDHANSHGAFDPTVDPITQSNLCVTGDTKVDVRIDGTEFNSVAIETIIGAEQRENIEIRCRNIETGEVEFKHITRSAETGVAKEIIEITDEATGRTIRCTPEHQIYTKNRGYVEAQHLREDDVLEVLDAESGKLNIASVTVELPVYDVTVDGNANFYANGVLVHNCQEISLPTRYFTSIDSHEGRVSLCTLSALNIGNTKTPEDFEKPARIVVRFLDNLLSYQDYPLKAAEIANEEYRPLGVGLINLAHFFAKNGVKYDESALPLIDEYMEAMSYYLIKASVDLAEEKGACGKSHLTRYGQGIMPIDTRKREVDELVPHKERLDWDGLREKAKRVGIRNATLLAMMPAETSAQLSNSTNGIEPVRALVSEKVSKHGVLRQVVPDIQKLKNKYDLLWDQKSPRGYLKVVAILQKYTDQSISTNTSYNPAHYEDGKISMKDMIDDLLLAYRWGIKNLYYFNTNDSVIAQPDDIAPEEGILEELDDEICDSCVL